MKKPEKKEIPAAVGKRLKKVRIMLGFDRQEDLGRTLGGFAFSQVSRAERGQNLPPPEMLRALAENWINVNWLLTGQGGMFIRDAEHPGPVIPPPEMGGVLPAGVSREDFGHPPEPYYGVREVVEPGYQEIDREDPRLRIPGRIYVPIIDQIAAGPPGGMDRADSFAPGDADTFLVYNRPVPQGAFALKVAGNSMEPKYRRRDVVIVDPAVRPESGEACIIYKDAAGERLARLKVLRRRGRRLFLESLNPAYKSAELNSADLIAAFGICGHLPWVSRRRRQP